MLNSETVYIPDTEFTSYRIDVPAIQPQKITNLILDADKRVYLQSITVYYDTANGTVEPEKETVATPQFTPAGGNITKGSVVAISCSTPDADYRRFRSLTANTALHRTHSNKLGYSYTSNSL